MTHSTNQSGGRLTWLRWLWISVVVVAVDLSTKYYFDTTFTYGETRYVTPFFNWVLVYNPGAAFSFLANAGGWQREFFIVVTLVITSGLLWLLKSNEYNRLLGGRFHSSSAVRLAIFLTVLFTDTSSTSFNFMLPATTGRRLMSRIRRFVSVPVCSSGMRFGSRMASRKKAKLRDRLGTGDRREWSSPRSIDGKVQNGFRRLSLSKNRPRFWEVATTTMPTFGKKRVLVCFSKILNKHRKEKPSPEHFMGTRSKAGQ
jgi:hypothetical protein